MVLILLISMLLFSKVKQIPLFFQIHLEFAMLLSLMSFDLQVLKKILKFKFYAEIDFNERSKYTIN